MFSLVALLWHFCGTRTKSIIVKDIQNGSRSSSKRIGIMGVKLGNFNGKEYIRSPFMLLYVDDCYYCLMYDPRMKKIVPYRVDRMKYTKVIDNSERDGVEFYAEMDKKTYTQYTFGMFGGDIVRVNLLCHTKLMNVIIDKFGKDVWTTKVDKDHFTTTVTVAVSPQFFGWICGLGEQVEITGPADVKQQFIDYIETISKRYKNSGN